MQFLQQTINGITIGSFYALVALGYTMVYGVLKMINFAHGGMFMWGAYIGLTVTTGLVALVGYASPWALVPTLIAVMVAVAGIGVLVERVAYRPLRTAGRLAPLISALGMAFILESLARNVYGASWKTYLPGLVPGGRVALLGNVRISVMQVLVLLVSFLLMALLYLFVYRTRVGTAMRAVAQDHEVSRLMGIDVDRIIATVFLIGPGLGGMAGLIVGTYYGSFDFTLGWSFGLRAFIAAILGGIGNIPGAMLGGMLLGIVETFAAGYISPQWKDVIAYVILIFILIFRPTGLLGERVAEKL
ncbi:MAG: branched-chain amino acid ABC transporter permease [Anaerolineae bacterium]|nr:branched-chain amino acid ABC transporter permease [Anaerolineae bacterium]MCX8067910.1 branched-chain amino acid ABC transporter permease [Anaerolineae bacterium]MDW7991335.1 branched-chain amino acid ABC transporter permease [Anaerolineae bacterium]